MDKEAEKKALNKQINVLKGQLEGIRKMIENEEDCTAIITQLKAVKSGLNKASKQIISLKLQDCLMAAGNKKGKINQKELEEILTSLSKY